MVISYFNNKGYKLATELLVHSTTNTKLNSLYEPHNINVVKKSSGYKTLKNKKSKKGTYTFKNSGSVYDKDCYYALHKVSFTKPSTTSTKVTITDKYDFATGNYSILEGIAVDAMKRELKITVI